MLFLQNDSSIEWATDTLGEGHYLQYQFDGNLVIYNDSVEAVWATHTAGGTPGGVVMQDDGDLVVYDDENNLLFASKCSSYFLSPGDSLQPGDKLCSPNLAYFATLQNDGNFAVYNAVGIPVIGFDIVWEVYIRLCHNVLQQSVQSYSGITQIYRCPTKSFYTDRIQVNIAACFYRYLSEVLFTLISVYCSSTLLKASPHYSH